MNQYYQKDLYAILGVEPDAGEAQIKAAYRKQARKWHPDVNDNSEESIVRFKEITEAYEVLTDEQRRSQYDILKGFNFKSSYSSTSKTQAKKAYSQSESAQTKTDFKPEPKAKTEEKYHDKSSFYQVFENILDGLFTNE